jgi:hypothetical protein
MSEESRKILEMLSNGTISVAEAEQLLRAVSEPASSDGPGSKPRYFRILVNKPAQDGRKAESVNIRVPMSVVRGGLRLSGILPGLLGKKKIQMDNGTELDLSKLHYEDLEAMIKDIGELTVDVNGDAEVRIRCE